VESSGGNSQKVENKTKQKEIIVPATDITVMSELLGFSQEA
jgi:hypothetical protein